MARAIQKILRYVGEKLIGVEETMRRRSNEQFEDAVRETSSQKTKYEVWVSADGRSTSVWDMDSSHCKNALALVIRCLRENKVAYRRADGRVVFAKALHNMIDGQIAWQDEETGSFGRTNE